MKIQILAEHRDVESRLKTYLLPDDVSRIVIDATRPHEVRQCWGFAKRQGVEVQVDGDLMSDEWAVLLA